MKAPSARWLATGTALPSVCLADFPLRVEWSRPFSDPQRRPRARCREEREGTGVDLEWVERAAGKERWGARRDVEGGTTRGRESADGVVDREWERVRGGRTVRVGGRNRRSV